MKKATDAPLYNSRITDSYLKLVRKKYPYVNIAELLDYAGMKDYEVADQAHWFTQEQVNRFQEKLVQMTGCHTIAREAGRYTASVDALGVLRQYVLGMIGAAHTLTIIGKTASKLTRSSVYESRRLTPNRLEVVVTPVEEGVERAFQCENRVGFMEATFLIFNNRMPVIEHPECMFAGGKVCRYLIPLEKTPALMLKRMRDLTALGLFFLHLALSATGNWSVLQGTFLLSLSALFLLSLAAERREKQELRKSLNNTVETSDNLLEQININYNNALLTNEIAQGLGSHPDTESILTNLTKTMQKRLKYDRGAVFLATPNAARLVLMSGYGYTDEELSRYNRLSFHLDRPASRGVFVRSFREQRPFLVNDLNEIEATLSPRSLAFARKLGAQAFICCPIICEGQSLGILAVDNVQTKKPLVQSDMSLLMGIASVIGISIRNAELLHARVRVLGSVLQTLAASIDARDPLTAGHSEKVTEYSLGISRELGLPPEYCDVIRVAALLHDYGKIGVPDMILKKKGRLTPEEYEAVKAHSGKTLEILSKINFEGIYAAVPEIAGAHHEKIDGSGYPRGAQGAEIPLGGRIIAVADYFEAVTAKRHYHEPIQVQEAFTRLRLKAGTHFEGRIVEALIAYYSRTYLEECPFAEFSDANWPEPYREEALAGAETPAG